MKTLTSHIASLPICRGLLLVFLLGAVHTPAAEKLMIAVPELQMQSGVVVKFGQDAGITVRKNLFLGSNVTLTSIKDSSVGGQTTPLIQTPAAGDWKGLKIEASATVGNFDGLTIRYGGGQGTAALELFGNATRMDNLLVSNNIIGIRATSASTTIFQGLSLINNQTGMEADLASAPHITGSEISGNSVIGIINKTPETIVQALGNWWGSPSGPNDPIGNPTGQGDKVSTGVNYGSYASLQPLINCSVQPPSGNGTTDVATITLSLSCRNATQYRLSEAADFAGKPFSPMATSVSLTLSPAAGTKTIYAEFKNNSGASVVSTTSIVLNPSVNTGPIVTITAPTGTVTANTTITVTATDPVGVQKVEFFVDNVLLATVNQAPYSTAWDITNTSNGVHTIKIIATNTAQLATTLVQQVTVNKPNTDVTGPVISDIKFAGTPLIAGATITSAGTLTLLATDASGINQVQVKVGSVVLSGGTLVGSNYSQLLDFNTVPNGPHALTITATDIHGNATLSTLNINVTIPLPAAPVISSPINNASVSQSLVTVSGTAPIGTQVQLFLNGTATGGLINVNTNGNFSGSLSLPGEGTYTLNAEARNSRGSTAGANLQLTYQIAGPKVILVSPTANTNLSAPLDINVSVIDTSAIQKVEIFIDNALLTSLSAPPYSYRWDINQATDGPHTVKAIATNSAHKTGEALANVTVSKIPVMPPPPPTPYTGEVTGFSPPVSYGEQNIIITGRAKDRATGTTVNNVPLKLVLAVAGFQRKINLVSDGAGAFSYTFVPQLSDAGTYTISVIHPDETVFPNQGQFTINRVSFNPTRYSLNAARGFPSTIQINATASAGAGSAGVRLVANPADQPSGNLPAGITVNPGTLVDLAAGQSAPIFITFTGDNNAAETGTVILTGQASASGSAKRGEVRIDYRLSQPLPSLFPTPTYIETGVAQGKTVTEILTLENKGLIPATNLTVQLINDDGSAPPAWVYLATTGQLGNLIPGQKQTVQITAAPTATVIDGIYNFKLNVSADNSAGGTVPVAVSVTQAGIGSVQFKTADIYTNTLDKNGAKILGVPNATIKIQNEAVLSVQQTVYTNAQGEVTIPNLPTGRYTYRASAVNHVDTSGRFQIKPGVTTIQNVFLDYNLVTVEWQVNETTIQDRYDITLTATYQTQVPAPVILMEPVSINLPDMQQGEEFTGEISITNYGLVRADHVVFTPPAPDEYFKVEFLGSVPTELAAKQRVTLPYKVTLFKALPNLSVAKVLRLGKTKPGLKSGGTCNSFTSTSTLAYDYECANGEIRGGGAISTFHKAYGSCGGSGGGGGGGGGGGFGGGGYAPSAQPLTPQCTPDCGKGVCCLGSGPGAPGSPGPSDGPGAPNDPGPGPGNPRHF